MKKILLIALASVFIISCKTKKETTEVVSKTGKTKKVMLPFFIDSVTVKKHLYTLASDEMEGRKSGTEGIEKAAKYIENEFKRIGLGTFEGLDSYRQTFNFTNNK